MTSRMESILATLALPLVWFGIGLVRGIVAILHGLQHAQADWRRIRALSRRSG